mgnify:FL=1
MVVVGLIVGLTNVGSVVTMQPLPMDALVLVLALSTGYVFAKYTF